MSAGTASGRGTDRLPSADGSCLPTAEAVGQLHGGVYGLFGSTDAAASNKLCPYSCHVHIARPAR